MLRYYKHLKCSHPYVKALSFSSHVRRPAYFFRRAIAHQEWALKQWLTEEMGTKHFSLDHHPVPFSALKRIFLKQQGINPDALSYEAITVELLQDWQQFHGSLAEYRVVDTQFNYFINGWYSTYWHDLDRWAYFSCRGTY